MKFKTDENMPVEAADDLRQAGHDAVTVTDQQLAGQPDVRVADACRAEGRAVMTLDLDFADIRVYPPSDYAGIIVLRPSVRASAGICCSKLQETRRGQAQNPALWPVAQAVSEILPDGDKEKQVMQGRLNQREQLAEAQGQLF